MFMNFRTTITTCISPCVETEVQAKFRKFKKHHEEKVNKASGNRVWHVHK